MNATSEACADVRTYMRARRLNPETRLSFPKLVDDKGNVMVAAIRHEIATRWKGAGAYPVGWIIATLFAKARIQRAWARKEIAERAEDRARQVVANAAFEAEAERVAAANGYDVSVLNFHYTRHKFGSLADTNHAPHWRRIYARAVEIACDWRVDHLQAAE